MKFWEGVEHDYEQLGKAWQGFKLAVIESLRLDRFVEWLACRLRNPD